MHARRSSVLVLAFVAVAALGAGCGSSSGESDTTDRPGSTVDSAPDSTDAPDTTDGQDTIDDQGTPAEVIDSTVVYFDPDALGPQPDAEPPRLITDEAELDTFAELYIDDDPGLGTAASDALAAGQVLIGGPVSRSCFAAGGAQLAYTADEIRLLPTEWSPDDGDIECVRAVTSIGLVAVDPANLPDGLPITGL